MTLTEEMNRCCKARDVEGTRRNVATLRALIHEAEQTLQNVDCMDAINVLQEAPTMLDIELRWLAQLERGNGERGTRGTRG